MFYWNNYHLSHTHTHTQTWEGENRKQKRLGKCKIQWFNPQIKNVVWSINWCGVCVFIFFFSFCSCVEAKEFIVILIIIIIITLAVLTCAHDERSQQLPLAKVRSVEIFMSYWLARKLVQSLWESLAVHSKVEHVFGLWLSTFTVVCPGCTFECVH